MDTTSTSAYPFISTGDLPTPEDVGALVAEAHAHFGSVTDGAVSQVYPALARMPADLFGICIVSATGRVYEAGDADHPFSIMSVSKPFVFALVCQVMGWNEVRARVGANRAAVQLACRGRGERRWPHQPHGQRRRNRHY